jgi:putative FmdB family regulatory protein
VKYEMPTYEYECQKCGNRFEIQRKATEKPLRKCTHVNGGEKACGGDLKKLFFPAAIIFKGSGWHIKDYAKGGANGGSKSKSEDKESSSSEPKIEAKSSSDTKSGSDSKSRSDTKSETRKETVSASKD